MMTDSLSSRRPAAHFASRLPDDSCGLHESGALCTNLADPLRAVPLRLLFKIGGDSLPNWICPPVVVERLTSFLCDTRPNARACALTKPAISRIRTAFSRITRTTVLQCQM